MTRKPKKPSPADPDKKTVEKRVVGDGTPGPGRPKGVPNKTTMAVKEALTIAFEGIGGAERLMAWATANETEFFKLWAKMLPTDVNANVTLDAVLSSRLEAAVRRARAD